MEFKMKFEDEFIENHFQNWLKSTVHEDEREKVEKDIRQLLSEHPDLMERNDFSWSETRKLTEGR